MKEKNWLLSCHSSCWQCLLTHWAKMSLLWCSGEMHLLKDGAKVSMTVWAQLLASADKHEWLFAGQLCRSHPAQGTQAKALFPPVHGRFSCCNDSYWQFPLQRFQVSLNCLPVNIKSQEELYDSVWSCCFWVLGHYCCLFTGFVAQMSEAAFAMHRSGRKKCWALNVNITVSCGGFEEKVRVLQTWFGSCRNNAQANRWSLQGGKSLKDSEINELRQDFSGSSQNSCKSV